MTVAIYYTALYHIKIKGAPMNFFVHKYITEHLCIVSLCKYAIIDISFLSLTQTVFLIIAGLILEFL